MTFRVVIPARYASTRLPGKPLADICGKPMVVRVAEAVTGCGASGIWIATDDDRVAAAAMAHGLEVAMTRADHPSGTDRIAEVAMQFGWTDDEIVVNVQGDEPLIDPQLVARVAAALAADGDAAVATAAHGGLSAGEFFDPNVVKVVLDGNGRARYFSRAPIPWARDAFAGGRERLPENFPALRHVGLYAYRVGFLRAFSGLSPAPTEHWEALEQLRALWHGYGICVVSCVSAPAQGVDTSEDLERVRRRFADAARV